MNTDTGNWLVRLVVVVSALISVPAFGGEPGTLDEDAIRSAGLYDGELSRDLKLFCDSERLSGVSSALPPAKKAGEISTFMAAQGLSKQFKDVFQAISSVHPDDRSSILQAAAMEQRVGLCTLAESGIQEVLADAKTRCAKGDQKLCKYAQETMGSWQRSIGALLQYEAIWKSTDLVRDRSADLPACEPGVFLAGRAASHGEVEASVKSAILGLKKMKVRVCRSTTASRLYAGFFFEVPAAVVPEKQVPTSEDLLCFTNGLALALGVVKGAEPTAAKGSVETTATGKVATGWSGDKVSYGSTIACAGRACLALVTLHSGSDQDREQAGQWAELMSKELRPKAH